MRKFYHRQNQHRNRSAYTAIKLVVLAILMFCFTFALVPLYDVFCDITGINGKTDKKIAHQSFFVDEDRTVKVEFVTYVNPKIGWKFDTEIKRLTVYPGETRTITYKATNNTSVDSIGQAIPSVTPGSAAKYLNKTECFCFNHQYLAAGKDTELTLVFYVDPAIPNDIKTLTLSYTMFKAKSRPVT
ncbi:cytochrome c oxidase assembly protein [Candidatus Enterovibrio escicola]|uniref:cytochrome c oxidase assembly protein n=1 Tax=Candidatus Enterovibrio escicola TaxID=1927127 RepID=UPI001238392F|nr:cytochrome c oxidase assembly protein [Candidatus Enterovibrio escacola]